MEYASCIFGVVLYNKRLDESKTLNSLFKILSEKNIPTRIIIYNNGPFPVDFDELSLFNQYHNLSVDIENYLDNKPLSTIYNKFIRCNYEYEKYIILDDDTILTKEYLSVVLSKKEYDFDLQIPVIQDELGGVLYPLVNGEIINEKIVKLNDTDEVYSIGSGMVISKNLVHKLYSHFNEIFDERFVFYGVDINLFKKIINLRGIDVDVNISLLPKIFHSLSSQEKKTPRWRRKERFIDDLLNRIIYSDTKRAMILSLSKVLFINIIYLRFYLLPIFFYVVINGYHPRSSLNKNIK